MSPSTTPANTANWTPPKSSCRAAAALSLSRFFQGNNGPNLARAMDVFQRLVQCELQPACAALIISCCERRTAIRADRQESLSRSCFASAQRKHGFENRRCFLAVFFGSLQYLSLVPFA